MIVPEREDPIVFERRQFGSDNYSGVCPPAWRALADANDGHAPAYGADEWTRKAADALRDFFETECEIFFTFNGTAANSMALASLCRSYHSILCAQTAHVETDECGAPEFFSNGTKILLVPSRHGKVELHGVEEAILRRDDIHFPKPRVLSLTQATELGTVYSLDETRAACELAQKHKMHVHMDGARFANALAHLQAPPAELTWRAGVEALCLGGTKNGMAYGDAVVFFNRELAWEFDYRCKQAGQLASKMRFISASWIGMLDDNAYLKNAQHANACARKLADRIESLPGLEILYPVQANSVFLKLPPAVIEKLHSLGWHFYNFIGEGGCRFMCSWDTQDEDIEALAADIEASIGNE